MSNSFSANGTRLQLRSVVGRDDYGNQQSLGSRSSLQWTKLPNALSLLYKNVVNFLNDKEKLKCTAKDALVVWNAHDKIMESL